MAAMLPPQIHLASWRVKSPPITVLLCDWIKEVGRLADCFMQIGFLFFFFPQSDCRLFWKCLTPTCFKLFYPSLRGIAVHAVHLKKGRLKGYGFVQKVVHLTLVHRRSKTEPVWVRSQTLALNATSVLTVHHNKGGGGVVISATALVFHQKLPPTLVLFWCFLDSRKENKTEGCNFPQLISPL